MGTRFDMIGIFVKNLQQMVAFYRDVLGFEIEWDGSGPYAELNMREFASPCTSGLNCQVYWVNSPPFPQI